MRESMESVGGDYFTWFQPLIPEGAILGFVPTAVADSTFADWLEREEFDARGLSHALWWWTSRGDTNAIERYLERGGWRAQGLAALALARGDTAEALLRFEEREPAWDHPNNTTIVHARLLKATGRKAEALKVLQDRFVNDWPLASRVVWVLERARLAEQVGEAEQAIRDYRFVTRVWTHADPELQPSVREAESAVLRLGG